MDTYGDCRCVSSAARRRAGTRVSACRGVLVGKDAGRLDEAVRAKPNQAYDYAALFSQIAASASNTASTD